MKPMWMILLILKGLSMINSPVQTSEILGRISGREARILNGVPVMSRDSWKYMVRISISPVGFLWKILKFPVCSGSIISQNVVLTAATCFTAKSDWTRSITAGDLKVKTKEFSEQRILVKEVFKHPNFREEYANHDLALARLESNLRFGDAVGSISLPRDCCTDSSQTNYAGEYFTGVGYGLSTVYNFTLYPDFGTIFRKLRFFVEPLLAKLRFSNGTAISDSDCQAVVNNPDTTAADYQQVICVDGSQGQAPCFIDAGGPLVYGELVIGVITQVGITLGCGRRFPSLAAELSGDNLSWLNEKVAQIKSG